MPRDPTGRAGRLAVVNDSPSQAGAAAAGSDQAASEPLGPNAWLVEEMYEQYQADPASVSETWQDFFADYSTPGRPAAPATTAPRRLHGVGNPAPIRWS